MTAINRATVSFNERPDIKVDGKSKQFKMMSVKDNDGNKSSFIGVKLGDGTYAKLTNRPDGKYDVTMFRPDGKRLPDFPVRISEGTVSRIQTADGKFNQLQLKPGDGNAIKFNEKFATEFVKTAEKHEKPATEERLEGLEKLRGELSDRIENLGKMRHVPFSDTRAEFNQLKQERDDVDARIARAKAKAMPEVEIGVKKNDSDSQTIGSHSENDTNSSGSSVGTKGTKKKDSGSDDGSIDDLLGSQSDKSSIQDDSHKPGTVKKDSDSQSGGVSNKPRSMSAPVTKKDSQSSEELSGSKSSAKDDLSVDPNKTKTPSQIPPTTKKPPLTNPEGTTWKNAEKSNKPIDDQI